MINVLTIFLAQYFQGKNYDVVVKIPPLTQRSRRSRVHPLPKFSFSKKINEKNITLGQLIQASCPWGATFLGRKGLTNSPDQVA
jgi:hypothetical protein